MCPLTTTATANMYLTFRAMFLIFMSFTNFVCLKSIMKNNGVSKKLLKIVSDLSVFKCFPWLNIRKKLTYCFFVIYHVEQKLNLFHIKLVTNPHRNIKFMEGA